MSYRYRSKPEIFRFFRFSGFILLPPFIFPLQEYWSLENNVTVDMTRYVFQLDEKKNNKFAYKIYTQINADVDNRVRRTNPL